MDDKEKPENKDKLVDSAETILNSELTVWVQQMESAMAKIYEQKPNLPALAIEFLVGTVTSIFENGNTYM